MKLNLKLSVITSLVCIFGFASASVAQTSSKICAADHVGPCNDVLTPSAENISLVRCVQRSDFASHASRRCDVTIQLEDHSGNTTEIVRSCTTNKRGICIAWKGTPAALASTLDLTSLNPVDSFSAFISNVSPVAIFRFLEFPNCYTSQGAGGSVIDSSSTEILKEGIGIKRATATYSERCSAGLIIN